MKEPRSLNYIFIQKRLFKILVYTCKFETQSKYIREAGSKQKQRPPKCGMNTVSCVCNLTSYVSRSVADPDFELRRGPGSILLAQPGFSPSVISSFFYPKIKWKGGGVVEGATPLRKIRHCSRSTDQEP